MNTSTDDTHRKISVQSHGCESSRMNKSALSGITEVSTIKKTHHQGCSVWARLRTVYVTCWMRRISRLIPATGPHWVGERLITCRSIGNSGTLFFLSRRRQVIWINNSAPWPRTILLCGMNTPPSLDLFAGLAVSSDVRITGSLNAIQNPLRPLHFILTHRGLRVVMTRLKALGFMGVRLTLGTVPREYPLFGYSR